MDIAILFSSAVVAAIVAGLVTLRANERNIQVENITKQRQLWREKIREISKKICSAYASNEHHKIRLYYLELQLLLNPTDSGDIGILDTVWDMRNETSEPNLDVLLAEKLSLLLKYDWERVKAESKPSLLAIISVSRLPHTSFEKSKYKALKEARQNGQ